MKNILFTTLFVASFGATTASAGEIFADYSVSSAVGSVSSSAAQDLQNCLQSDMELASSKAIRACSKAYKVSAPNYEVRSDILTRRGLLQLSAGRFDKASRDFKSAARLNDDNEFAYLGNGYAAIMQKDYASAAQYFNDCASHKDAAPLALYGLGLTKELSGDMTGAVESYRKAAAMRPDWQTPREELARLDATL